jgi:hypothetical protein
MERRQWKFLSEDRATVQFQSQVHFLDTALCSVEQTAFCFNFDSSVALTSD